MFMADTGTSVGEISGQSKPINSCDFKPTRPFRIITGSEDNTIGIYEGPPFKFKMTKTVLFQFPQINISHIYSKFFTFRSTVGLSKQCGILLMEKNLLLEDLTEKCSCIVQKTLI